jgi:hypothetical protein
MGLFVHFRGAFECVRCRRVSDALIQTKLLRHEADNSSRGYRTGDAEALVGLDDYCPLHPWDGGSPLVVAVGDWDCAHCGLNWQWARAVFDVRPELGPPVVMIRELSGFQPWQATDLGGVHFVETELAELSGLWPPLPAYNWPEGRARWGACPVSERCERVAAGFREWCREVARAGSVAESSADPAIQSTSGSE